MTNPGTPPRLGQGARVAVVVAAGAAAFVVGMRLHAPLGAQQAEADIVTPAERRAARTAVAPSAAFAEAVVPEAESKDRLSEQVGHNPFGTLNLNAGVIPSAIDEARARTELKKPENPPKPPPPPPPPPAPPPPPPVAPPLPFTAVGSIAGSEVTDGKQVAFIKQQEHLLVVRAGDAIGQHYRVESVTGQRIEFMYLPLMQRQALTLAP